MEYIVTEKECLAKCEHRVCLRCGGPLSPIDTVDNSGHPTFWTGCEKCGVFSYGTTDKIYKLAEELHKDFNTISLDNLCSIVGWILIKSE